MKYIMALFGILLMSPMVQAAELNLTQTMVNNPKVQKILKSFCDEYCMGNKSDIKLQYVGLNVGDNPYLAKVTIKALLQIKQTGENGKSLYSKAIKVNTTGRLNTKTCKISNLTVKTDNSLLQLMAEQMRLHIEKILNQNLLPC